MHTIKPWELLSNREGIDFMKKAILIYFCIVLTMLFTGCRSGNINNEKTDDFLESKLNVADYNVVMKDYISYNEKNNPYTVKYAQISGIGNEKLENRINQTLKSAITEWLNKNCEWMEKSQITIKRKNSQYLSLCYMIEWKNSQCEDFMSTYTRIGVTVDIQTGDRVYLNDLIKDTDGLKQKLEKYDYGNEFSPPIDFEEADEIIHEASISESKYLEEISHNDPYAYDEIKDEIGSKTSFYLTDNKLVITRNEYDLNDVYIDFK